MAFKILIWVLWSLVYNVQVLMQDRKVFYIFGWWWVSKTLRRWFVNTQKVKHLSC